MGYYLDVITWTGAFIITGCLGGVGMLSNTLQNTFFSIFTVYHISEILFPPLLEINNSGGEIRINLQAIKYFYG